MYALKEPCEHISQTLQNTTNDPRERKSILSSKDFRLFLEHNVKIKKGSRLERDYLRARDYAVMYSDNFREYEKYVQVAAKYVGV